MSYTVPVLYIIFNRLETTKQSFKAIRQQQPKFLFIAADGPRDGNFDDIGKCQSVRDWVISNIDWDCEVKTLFQEKNLGCGRNPAGAISWFFDHVEEGIILEDDCIASPSFFLFCQVLLEKYRYNEHFFVIGGNNFQSQKIGSASYYFSAMGHIWGWATWRRAWKHFNYDLNIYDESKYLSSLKYYFKKKQQIDFWHKIFISMKSKPVNDIWDYQWSVCQWYNRAINIVPNENLVSNIGYGNDATHTKSKTAGIMELSLGNFSHIKHPQSIVINKKADLYTFYKNFEHKKKSKFWIKCKEKIKYEIRKIFNK